MSDYKYKYKCPTEQGYIKVNISKRKLRKFKLGYFKVKFFEKYEVYFNLENGHYKIHKFYNWLYIVLSVLLFPLSVLFGGLANWKEIIYEHKRLFNQKKYGSFSSESFHRGKYLKWDEFVDNEITPFRG